MKTIFSKRLALIVSATAVAIAAPLASFALGYGPANRQTFTWTGDTTQGADHVVFNSFTNTPNVGDERFFFGAKDAAATTSGGYQDTIQVNPGQEILLRTYVHNNADASLNASGAGVATNTRVRVFLPTATGTSLGAVSYVSADNAVNKDSAGNVIKDTNGASNVVTDGVNFQDSAVPFGVTFEPGSATIYNEAHPAGLALSDNIVGATGTQIGYDKMDGNLPGCFQYVSLVTIKVKINGPALSFSKTVSVAGSGNWQPTLNAKVGDTVSFLLNYKNTSGVQANSVVLKDQLPAHLKVVPGTVKVYDSNRPAGQLLSDTGLFTIGVNVGDYGANGGGYIGYRAVVTNDFAATDCNDTLVNSASAEAQGLAPIKGTASVIVTRTCQPVTPPVTPVVTPVATTQLPDTGAGALAGTAGLGSLAYAGRAYLRSKKSLLDSLRK